MNIGGWRLSWTTFGTYLGPRCSQDRCLDDLGRHSGSILEVIFAKNMILLCVVFSLYFERHVFRIFMDFGAHFHDFWAPKPTPIPKRRKYEKPVFYLHETYVLEGPGLSFLVEKSLKNGVGTRKGLGGDFFTIFDGFGSPFWAPKSIKINKK